MSEPIITFTNPSIINWLESRGIKGKRMSYVTPADVVHKHVYGHLPLWLAAYAQTVSEVALPNLSKPDRERFNRGELSVKEMDSAEAYIASYVVRPL